MLSTYKQLSKNNQGWKKVYVAEKPWREMAIDVDSLVFFYMRKYVDMPYPTRKDENMVAAAFADNPTRAMQWVVEDMARYCNSQLVSLLKYLRSTGLVLHSVCSTGYPRLKRGIRDERLQARDDMRDRLRGMDVSQDGAASIMSLAKKYILHFRDEVRDIVVEHPRLKGHIHRSKEADKWCGKNHRVTMSEDVDIFLFGDRRTTIVKPFLADSAPTHFNFVDCKSYFTDKGIATHDDFVQVAFMVGTDYNRGVKRMGVDRSVKAIRRYGTVERYVAVKYDLTDENVEVLMKRYRKFIEYVRS